MEERAEEKAFFALVFHVSPTEFSELTLREKEAFYKVAKRNKIIET